MTELEIHNPFVRPSNEYKRDLNFIGHYVSQMAVGLARLKNISEEEARAFINSKIQKGGEREFKDIPLDHTYRKPNGDRIKVQTGWYAYVKDAVANRNIIAPTLTRYIHPSILESPLVVSIDENVAKRNVNRAASREAEMTAKRLEETKSATPEVIQAHYDLALNKNNEQTGNKLSNNALSGSHVSSSTPLVNRSGHTTLTSTCRLTSGSGNANNERLIAGNRHYHRPSIAIANITSIVESTDYDKLQQAIDKYNIHLPTTAEVMKMIEKCSKRYWRGPKPYKYIEALVDGLKPIERAAVLYTGDLHHLRIYNDQLLRNFLGALGTRITEPLDFETSKEVVKKFDGAYIALVNQLQGDDMKGISLKAAQEGNPVLFGQVAATLLNVNKVLAEYRIFIEAFFVTPNSPASLAYLPSIVRESAITSDTDSTIFTVQEWSKWWTGEYKVDEESTRIAASVAFISAQTIRHILALMSANIGVEDKRLHQIDMKSEFRFDVYYPTEETKHYYTIIGCKDGNVFGEYELERKGVHLRNSSVAPEVMEAASNMMFDNCVTIAKGEKIDLQAKMQEVADYELEILNDIRSGRSSYFKYEKVNDANSYKLDETRSRYAAYTMWRDVFAPKYGDSETPPYIAYKINTVLNNRTKFRLWLEKMKDRALAERLIAWMERNNKETIETFYLPATIVYANGVPEEIFEIIDVRRIITTNASVFYKILETLNFFHLDSKLNRLISDYPDFSRHSKRPELKMACSLSMELEEM